MNLAKRIAHSQNGIKIFIMDEVEGKLSSGIGEIIKQWRTTIIVGFGTHSTPFFPLPSSFLPSIQFPSPLLAISKLLIAHWLAIPFAHRIIAPPHLAFSPSLRFPVLLRYFRPSSSSAFLFPHTSILFPTMSLSYPPKCLSYLEKFRKSLLSHQNSSVYGQIGKSAIDWVNRQFKIPSFLLSVFPRFLHPASSSNEKYVILANNGTLQLLPFIPSAKGSPCPNQKGPPRHAVFCHT
jgi:hypothetical protein